jgi:capsid protein
VSGSAAGTLITLPAGYSARPADVSDVGANFEPYVKVALQHISAGANVPYPFLTEDYAGLTDRIYRAMTLEFRRTVTFVQKQVLIAQFCQPGWEWWVAAGVLQGVLELKNIAIEDVYETRWTTPAPGYINPVQEILAYEKAHDLGIMSLQQIAQETGADFTQITIENAMSVMLKETLAKDPRIQAIVARMAETHLATLTKDIQN